MRNKIIVEKILKYISKVIDYTKEIEYDTFRTNSILVEACVFNLSQIGELANKVSPEFQDANPLIPWRMIYGLRNRIVHDYGNVDLEVIYDTLTNDIPWLINKLEKSERKVKIWNT